MTALVQMAWKCGTPPFMQKQQIKKVLTDLICQDFFQVNSFLIFPYFPPPPTSKESVPFLAESM